MIDVHALKNYIINNPEYIELILEKSGFHHIKNYSWRNEIRCARDEGKNPTAVRIKKDTLAAVCFSTNLKGDLITLVQYKLHLSFSETIKTIAKWINFTKKDKQEEYQLPFGGFYKKIAKLRNNEPIDLEIYPEETLDRFELLPSLLFYEDGILPSVQREFKIGYDVVTNRITVPWRSFSGQLIGVMGRLNKKKVEDHEIKWFPIIPFPKSQTLFAFSENYHNIREKEIVLLGESEKFPLQLRSKNLNVGLGLGGNSISDYQINNIKSLFPKIIIVCLDEGLDEEYSREIAKKLKSNRYYKNKTGYIFDRHNYYLPKGSKLSPSDLDKNSLKKLIENCTIWI
ncbi:MAG TPA: hypothetical protein VIK94_03215 [Bacilli bacterium]